MSKRAATLFSTTIKTLINRKKAKNDNTGLKTTKHITSGSPYLFNYFDI